MARDSSFDGAASSSGSLSTDPTSPGSDGRASACVGHDGRSDPRTADLHVELLEGAARTPTVAWTAYPCAAAAVGFVTPTAVWKKARREVSKRTDENETEVEKNDIFTFVQTSLSFPTVSKLCSHDGLRFSIDASC